MPTNSWLGLLDVLTQGRYVKGNVVALNADGSVSVATADRSTIVVRPLTGQNWSITDGVLVQDGRIVMPRRTCLV